MIKCPMLKSYVTKKNKKEKTEETETRLLKSVLRVKLLSLLRNQKEETRLKKSKAIQKKLFSTPEFRRAKIVLFYASFDGEVETFMMMSHAQRLGKKVALPKIIRNQRKMIPILIQDLNTQLAQGAYGIKEPLVRTSLKVSLKELGLVLVPGVSFDRNNNRLGRGLGYYDRFLRKLPRTVPCVGLAFDFQIVDRLPHHKNRDIPVSRVVTN
ncbi:MAG: 5-formyltetrahydrofolate cyclo-ligase [Candidatus Omnitrophota bacterium]